MKTKIKIFGDIDPAAVKQLENCAQDERVVDAAIMADGHKGYSCPVGGVVSYSEAISPSGVGFDIACGNKAVKTDMKRKDINSLKAVMRGIQKSISFGIGRNNANPIDHELFDLDIWDDLEHYIPDLKSMAHKQLGTVGSGNHYVDLLVDKDENIWIANHFGSRGLGHKIATGFMNLHDGLEFTQGRRDSEDAIVLDTNTDLGQFYIGAMELAGEYAYAGRNYVIDEVCKLLDVNTLWSIHNHHNFAWEENGNWVVRKGATPLTSEPSFIGGSMGDISVIVKRHHWSALSRDEALGSAPHGAGRVMSRTKAAGKMRKMWCCSNRDCDWNVRANPGVAREAFGGAAIDKCPMCGGKKFRKLRTRDASDAAIDWGYERKKLDQRGIVVLGAGADESPGVYKDLMAVLGYHSNIEILEILEPIGVVMAGSDTFDPFAD